jgi:hypothetical protein
LYGIPSMVAISFIVIPVIVMSLLSEKILSLFTKFILTYMSLYETI